MRAVNAITTLVGDQLVWIASCEDTLAAPNGSLYGIPHRARRVAKFNPIDKSMTHIGPEFGGGGKWVKGAMTDSGIIYCLPREIRHGILKIDTNTDDVTELNANLLPEQGDYKMWMSCAAALDGCIYFMPSSARRIMKIDPNNNDAMTSVGDDLGGAYNYIGTVVGIDGCVYGIPRHSKRIVKYDPINDTTSFVGETADRYFGCRTGGTLGRDGCIYALAAGALAKYGRVLKIDTVNNSHYFVGSNIQSDHNDVEVQVCGWGDAILGIDGCIYWPPYYASRTLKYDPYMDRTSLVGDNFGSQPSQAMKWNSGALATDGIIYCIPSYEFHVLAIDPMGEFEGTTETNMHAQPEEFGSLFQTTIKADEDSGVNATSLTNFDIAVIKFGRNKVFEVLEKHMAPINDYCKESNLCPFMLVASQKESALCAIHHLLRRDLSWVNECISILELEGKSMNKRKRKYNTQSL